MHLLFSSYFFETKEGRSRQNNVPENVKTNEATGGLGAQGYILMALGLAPTPLLCMLRYFSLGNELEGMLSVKLHIVFYISLPNYKPIL